MSAPMPSPLQRYFLRSAKMLQNSLGRMAAMDIDPKFSGFSIMSFTDKEPPVFPVYELATGSDIDIGGTSTCEVTAVPLPESEGSGQSHIAFHGNLSLYVPPQHAGKLRTGYAAFRNKSRPSLFGEETWDIAQYSHLRVEVAYRGAEVWRNHWVCNLQTDGPIKTDLFQHRLDLWPSPESVENSPALDPLHCTGLQFATLHLPIKAFVHTNSGQVSETQVGMMRQKIRTLGFALLGGGRDTEAPQQTQTPEQAAALAKRYSQAAGGWGAPGANEEIDPELAEILADDGHGLAPAPGTISANASQVERPTSVGGYHRVGAAAAAPLPPPPAEAPAVKQGYYELCVRSVSAVNYNPELD